MVKSPTAQQRRTTMTAIAISAVAAAVLWFALLRLLPAPGAIEPLPAALACSAIAALLTLVLGIEAIAHERLFTAAIDPLAGVETPRMRVNLRYLSNTLEQFIVFAVGLCALSAYATPRLLVIITITWVVARWAFWIGYHRSPLLRAAGAPGMMQSIIVLLYVAYRAGADAYGSPAGVVLLIIFAAAEAFLFWWTKRAP